MTRDYETPPVAFVILDETQPEGFHVVCCCHFPVTEPPTGVVPLGPLDERAWMDCIVCAANNDDRCRCWSSRPIRETERGMGWRVVHH